MRRKRTEAKRSARKKETNMTGAQTISRDRKKIREKRENEEIKGERGGERARVLKYSRP